MKKWVPLVGGGALLLIGAGALTGGEPPQPAAVVAPALSVTIVHPQRGTMAATIPVTGMTVPRDEVRVMTELSGVRVQELRADAGDRVEKGQVLAVLDSQSLAHQMASLRSEYEQAQDAFARVDAIRDSGAVSRQQVIEKRAAMQAARARLAEGELNLRRGTVLAPAAGLVFARGATVGGLVSDSEPLFRIADHCVIEMEAMVPEASLAALAPGQKAAVRLAGRDGMVEGSVRLILPLVDERTRMARVRIGWTPALPVAVGLFATAVIEPSRREGVQLPMTALLKDSDGDYVWALDAADRVGRWPVTLLLADADRALIADIPLDLRIVARAGAFLRAGDHVRVVEDR